MRKYVNEKMKKIGLIFCLLCSVALLWASPRKEPYQILSMEDVGKWGANCDYDVETCMAVFKGSGNRWFDLPGVQGDYSKHTRVQFDVLQSNVILKVVVRYVDENGKTREITCAQLNDQMGYGISKKHTVKFDLRGDEDQCVGLLGNVISVRISMAKLCEGSEDDKIWFCHFAPRFMIY